MKRVLCGGGKMMALTAMLVAGQTFAGDLKAPFELDSTQVLPQGVRNPRFKNLFMWVDGKFNGSGTSEPLGAKLNKQVSWEDIISAQSTVERQNEVRGVVNGAGLQNANPGSTSGVVNSYANVKVPVIAMGVTDKLTIGFAVPIYQIEVRADTGFVKTEAGQKFVDSVCKDSSPTKCAEAEMKLNDAVNQKLTKLGYEPVQSQSVSGIGDVKAVAKYLLHSDDKNAFALRADLTTPTGSHPNADKVIDVPTGDGQWDVGVGAVYDRLLTRALRFNGYWGYTFQLADQLERRLPTSATDSLSADKELVSRNLGNIVSGGTSLSYTFAKVGLTFGAGYSFQHQTATTYEDGRFASERYRLLEAETPQQTLHSGVLSAQFSTVEWFKDKKFFLPMQAGFAFSKPLSGENVTTNDVLSAELVMFF